MNLKTLHYEFGKNWSSFIKDPFELIIDEVDDHRRVKSGTIIFKNGKIPIVDYIPRFHIDHGYVENWSIQWKQFRKTQLDSYTGYPHTGNRFWNNTKWKPEELAGKWVLEVGSGAGRFTEVLLEAGAKVVSFDMGLAVEANYLNNGGNDNLFLFQGNIYSMPVKDGFFDYVFCYGVLQHTPDPRKTIQCIYNKLKPGGKLSLDCYDKKWSFDPWHFPKFFWRPITTRMDLKRLYQLIEWYIPIWLPIDTFIRRIPIIGNYLSTLTTIPCWNYHFLGVSSEEKQKWAIMDTFDSMAAKYDQPLSLEVLKEMTKTHEYKELEVFCGSNGVVVNLTR